MHNFFLHRAGDDTIMCCSHCGVSYRLIKGDYLNHQGIAMWELVRFLNPINNKWLYTPYVESPCTEETAIAEDRTESR